ncbi:NAD(P)H-binding protein [Actinophytocola gossypii]|uniref:NAD(P)H-binding protein n=1 Tax=Actinophytocola gossypii TaxID=2812003 RepID=A0ABT2J619_9PSEU|nr:NAD(P)H-binding protein [Actinophytocola gossypii]MCT2583320.1 NAD(P)H-binding protein [Actinophytocola gossypii]
MILVTGATGNVGRHVVSGLLRAGERVRAVTRSPSSAGLPDGVEVVRGDLAHPETFATAFTGVTRMFVFPLAYLRPVLRDLSDVIEATDLVKVAAAAGVRRMVMLGSSDSLFDMELAVESSGCEWTILRPGEFAVNKLDHWAPMIRAHGAVRSAYPEACGAPIHEADIADVAVAALLDDTHTGRRYELTGPESLTLREQVAAIATGINRPIRFEEVTPEESRTDLLALGLPPDVVDHMFLAHPPGPAPISPTYEQITGHPPRTLTRWAADHAPAFTPT